MHGPEEPEKISSHSVLGLHPNNYSTDLNVLVELKHIPFPLNVGEAQLDKEQQSRFLDIIYDNQVVFHCMMRTSDTVIILLIQSQHH